MATRKQNLLLLVDTGRGMAASAPSGEPKSDLAVAACGLVGYLTLRHGDLVGLVHGSAEGTSATPFFIASRGCLNLLSFPLIFTVPV